MSATSRHVQFLRPREGAPPGSGGAVMTTGCVPCLLAARRCDPSYPDCLRHQISADWIINQVDLMHGTWRDRQGLYWFNRFVSLDERSGLWGALFPHAALLLACSRHKALYYLGASIGTLQNYVLRHKQGVSGVVDGAELTCAAKQRSRAVELLTSVDGLSLDPEMVLLACILFIWFESLQGNAEHLVTHCLQGRNLLRHLEVERETRGEGGLVDLDDARGVIIGLELQARCVPCTVPTANDPIASIRLSTFDSLHSLDHAYTTLRSAYVLLLDAIRNPILAHGDCDLDAWMQARSAKFVPWLEHWHDCFESLIALRPEHCNHLDKQRSNVLKVDYHCMTMLASLDLKRTTTSWSGYRLQFRAITDLAASVLRATTDCIEPSLSGTQFPLITPGFSLSGPLYTTMARCPEYETAWRAGNLLIPQLARTKQKENFLIPLSEDRVQVAEETDSWTFDDWIKFASESPLDIGMGVCLGGLKHSDDFAESLSGFY